MVAYCNYFSQPQVRLLWIWYTDLQQLFRN